MGGFQILSHIICRFAVENTLFCELHEIALMLLQCPWIHVARWRHLRAIYNA